MSQQNGNPLSNQMQNPSIHRNMTNMVSETFKARRFILDKIYMHLMRKQHAHEIAPNKMVDIVKRLEEALYKSAPSKEEYLNLGSLESRLHFLIKQIPSNHNPQFSHINSSSSIGTMISTSGMHRSVNSTVIGSSSVDNSIIVGNPSDDMEVSLKGTLQDIPPISQVRRVQPETVEVNSSKTNGDGFVSSPPRSPIPQPRDEQPEFTGQPEQERAADHGSTEGSRKRHRPGPEVDDLFRPRFNAPRIQSLVWDHLLVNLDLATSEVAETISELRKRLVQTPNEEITRLEVAAQYHAEERQKLKARLQVEEQRSLVLAGRLTRLEKEAQEEIARLKAENQALLLLKDELVVAKDTVVSLRDQLASQEQKMKDRLQATKRELDTLREEFRAQKENLPSLVLEYAAKHKDELVGHLCEDDKQAEELFEHLYSVRSARHVIKKLDSYDYTCGVMDARSQIYAAIRAKLPDFSPAEFGLDPPLSGEHYPLAPFHHEEVNSDRE